MDLSHNQYEIYIAWSFSGLISLFDFIYLENGSYSCLKLYCLCNKTRNVPEEQDCVLYR